MGTCYLANSHNKTISVIDTNTKVVTSTISGTEAAYLTITPDGTKLYVCNIDSNTVSVIDTTSNEVSSTINVGTTPSYMVITPDGKTLYVSNHSGSSIVAIDTASNIATPLSLGLSDGWDVVMGVSPDSKYLYVTNNEWISYDIYPSLLVVDVATNTQIDQVTEFFTGAFAATPTALYVGMIAANPSYNIGGFGVISSFMEMHNGVDQIRTDVYPLIGGPRPWNPYPIAVTPDASYVYATTSNQEIIVIKGDLTEVTTTIPVDGSMLVTPDGQYLYVLSGKALYIIDISSNTIIKTIDLSLYTQLSYDSPINSLAVTLNAPYDVYLFYGYNPGNLTIVIDSVFNVSTIAVGGDSIAMKPSAPAQTRYA